MIRTGIIVGVDLHTTQAHANTMTEMLTARFPHGVTFAIVAGAVDSIAFPFEDGVPEPDRYPSVTEEP